MRITFVKYNINRLYSNKNIVLLFIVQNQYYNEINTHLTLYYIQNNLELGSMYKFKYRITNYTNIQKIAILDF